MFLLILTLGVSVLDPKLSPDGSSLEIIGSGTETVTQNFLNGYSNSKTTKIIFSNVLILDQKCCYEMQNLKEILFDDSINEIRSACFQGCTGLKTITLPDSLLSLSDDVFKGCNTLSKLYIGSKLTSVSFKALEGTGNLSFISVDPNNKFFTTDINNLFLLSFDKKTLVRFPGTDQNVEVPYYVEVLEQYCAIDLEIPKITFQQGSKLKSVGARAFQYLEGCNTIEFPEGLETLSSQILFQSEVENIYLPGSLTTVDPNVFGDAAMLMNVTLGPNHKSLHEIDGIIYTKNSDSIIFLPPTRQSLTILAAVENVPATFISGAKSLETLTVHQDNKKFSEHYGLLYSFDGKNLKACPGGKKDVIIWENCEIIEHDVMYKVDIETIEFKGTKLKQINAGAISYTKIKTLKLPEGLTLIQHYGFQQCYELTGEIVFPKSFKTFQPYSFYLCYNLQKVDLSQCTSMTVIEEFAFYLCGITELKLPPSLETIQTKVFMGNKLARLEIPASVTQIDNECFRDNFQLAEIKFLGNKLTTLNSYVFGGAAIQSIDIPDSVEELMGYSLGNCTNLETINFGSQSKLRALAAETFAGSKNIVNITLGKNVDDVRPGALSQMNGLMDILVNSENKKYVSNNGVLYEKDFIKIVAFPGGRNTGTLHKNTVKIGQMAFYMCEMLETLQFGESQVNEIGASTFLGCIRLQRIEIPKTVSLLEMDAFKGCSNMSEVVFKADSILEELSSGVFTDCALLRTVTFESGSSLKKIGPMSFSGCELLESFISPPLLTEIGNQAFLRCLSLSFINFSENFGTISSSAFEGCSSLETVTIPSSVKNIKSAAFKDCSNLKTIYMCGVDTEAEDSSVFSGVHAKCVVLTCLDFHGDRFGGLPAIPALDSHCHVGSARFTQNMLTSVAVAALVEQIVICDGQKATE